MMQGSKYANYAEAYLAMSQKMDQTSPGWRQDKSAVKIVKRAARKTVEMSQRFQHLSEKYNQPEPDVRRAFNICQSWPILDCELLLAKAESRKIDFTRLVPDADKK